MVVDLEGHVGYCLVGVESSEVRACMHTSKLTGMKPGRKFKTVFQYIAPDTRNVDIAPAHVARLGIVYNIKRKERESKRAASHIKLDETDINEPKIQSKTNANAIARNANQVQTHATYTAMQDKPAREHAKKKMTARAGHI